VPKRRVTTFDRPFPALSAAQRFHLEVNGYVVVENTLVASAKPIPATIRVCDKSVGIRFFVCFIPVGYIRPADHNFAFTCGD